MTEQPCSSRAHLGGTFGLSEVGHVQNYLSVWKLVQEQLARCLQELQDENAKSAAHIQSLKKRRANLSVSTRL